MTTRIDFESLLAIRARTHRTASAQPMASVAEVAAWTESVGIALVSGKSALPSAAEAIAGEPIEGSWWGHRLGGLIYQLLNELDELAAPPLDLVLIDGKRTLVAPRIVPTLDTLAVDPARRARVVENLKQPQRLLWEAVATATEPIRADDPGVAGIATGPARKALEAGLLCRSTSVHTELGHHVSIIETFGHHLPAERPDDPLAQLMAAALRAAVVAEEREVLGWFRFVEPDKRVRAAALETVRATTVESAGRRWLTPTTDG